MALRVESRAQVAARESAGRAREHLLGLQHPGGWWKESSRRTSPWTPKTSCCGSSSGSAPRRRPPGGVGSGRSSGPTGPGRTSTAGRRPLNHHRGLRGAAPGRTTRRRRTWPWPSSTSGARGPGERPGVHPQWLALFGQWSWDQIPALPPEVIFLPEWFPLNIYDFACWARQTIVALTVVGAHRPNRPLGFSIDELRTERPRTMASPPRPGRGGSSAWIAPFSGTSATLPLVFAASPWPEPPSGSFAGRRRTELGRDPAALVYSLIALHLMGYPLDHSVMKAGLDGLIVTIVDGDQRRLEACQSPWGPPFPDRSGRRGSPARSSRSPRGDRLARARRDQGQGRLGRAPARPHRVDGPSNSPTTTIRHRRHRGGRPGPPAGGRGYPTGQAWNPPSTGASNGCWGCSPPMVMGCIRRRQHADALPGAAVLRLRRGHRPSQRRRDRSRGGDARGEGRGGERGTAGDFPGSPGTRSATARGLGGGGESCVRHGRDPGRGRRGHLQGRPEDQAGVRWLGGASESDGGWGEDLRSYEDRDWIGRSEHRLSDGVGIPRPPRGGQRVRLRRPRCGVAVRDPAAIGNVGRARVHGNRIPRRLLHQLPPVPFGLSFSALGRYLSREREAS